MICDTISDGIEKIQQKKKINYRSIANLYPFLSHNPTFWFTWTDAKLFFVGTSMGSHFPLSVCDSGIKSGHILAFVHTSPFEKT